MKNSRAYYRCWSGKIRFMALSDTSPEVEKMQADLHEAMSGEERVLLAFAMSHAMHELAKQYLRDRHPEWTEEQVTRAYLFSLLPKGARAEESQ
jgi:hypothetical protein